MWHKIIEELKKTESKNIIDAFIKPLSLVDESPTEIIVGCPSDKMILILEKNNYISKINDIARDLFSDDLVVNFIVKEHSDELQPLLPMSEGTKKKKIKKNPRLLSENTFQNFVAGPSNQTAYAAALSVAKNPTVNYNPIVIYGETGLGKTHIIQAVGNYLENRDKSVCYITSQQFINEYVSAISNKTIDKFRYDLLAFDLLLVDDIQFLSNKTSTQNEFFHIFNEYHSSKRQIILTSDRYPGEIKDIDDRLRSRFVWGVTFDIKPPEYETRLAIVRKKAAMYKLKLEEEVECFIAQHIKTNIREIEGALKTLQISSELMGKRIVDKQFAENILKDIIKVKSDVTIEDIIKLTSTYMRIKASDITGKSRTKQISVCRHIAIFLSKKYTKSTLLEIGQKFGGRNHSTIITAIRKTEQDMMSDPNIKKIIDKLGREIEETKF